MPPACLNNPDKGHTDNNGHLFVDAWQAELHSPAGVVVKGGMRVVSCEVLPIDGVSDHKPVKLVLE